jgi:outer membrane protein assembly factor BamE (lipoprotein component of BamABCDE complex)
MRCRQIRPLVWVLGLVLLSGCVLGRIYRDHPLDEQKIATIQRGVTTKAQVLEQFGPPQEIDTRELVAIGGGVDRVLSGREGKPEVESLVGAGYFRYTYSRANAFGIILLLFNYAEFDQKNDSLVIFFDSKDVVQDVAYERDTDKVPRFGFWSR